MSKTYSKQKSKTEELFEAYLSQCGFPFQHEPFSQGQKNPDYRFTKNGKTVLVEIKEIEETPFQKEVHAGLATSNLIKFGIDPKELPNLLRRRIDAACKQLKSHQREADYCVVILGQKETAFNEIGPESIFYAMYGDPYLSISMNPTTSKDIGKVTSEIRVNGALRKNRTPVKEMYSPHSYLSAVGIVEEFNGYRAYEEKFYNRILKQYRPPTAKACLKYLIKEWEKHQDKIPAIYRDKNKMYYRIHLITNPLTTKPIPRDFFSGRWDKVRYPKITNG